MIQSIEDLKDIKKAYLEKTGKYKYHVLVCGGSGCVSSNCGAVRDALSAEIQKQGLSSEIEVVTTGCIGTCAVGPIVYVLPDNTYYTEMTPEKAVRVVNEHLSGGAVIEEYTFFDAAKNKYVADINDMDFYKSQVRIALRNCGLIDVSAIEAYIAKDGYSAIAKVLSEMSPSELIEIITKSGLRGRGGGGFPTGIKWEACSKEQGSEKYIICNADEGDPGAFMDRSVFEGDAHSVIEGMMLGGYAIGARKGFVYIRAEYPLALKRLQEALAQAEEKGLLGKNILGSSFSFDIEIRIGAGAFVCGEETALMASIEGRRGEPRQKPPFPFESGLYGKPSIINNVETLANIAPIVLNGSDWFRSFGTEKSPGTKVFALSGHIRNTGLVEVPMGVPLGDILFDIGGGIPDNKEFKSAQTGGPSGGCITKEYLNIPMDYEHLAEVGSIMGSGGLIVMNEDTCMVDTARFYLDFIREESCGKCTACRLGTKRMLEILERITEGKGKYKDIKQLEELGEIIKDTAMCGLGQTAPNPVLSTIKYFREEYEEHIYDKHCRAGVCAELYKSPCENTCPAGINIPGFMALVASGRYTDAYKVMFRDNPLPGICGRVCTHPCETRCRRGTVDEAMAICEMKRFVTDYAYSEGFPEREQITPAEDIDKRVAVIGAGPSGLVCAYYLVMKGYKADVYEAEHKAGGMLLYGIPEYRLPKAMLQKEIDIIERAGVNIITGEEIGKNITFNELKKKYDAVYIASGAQKAVTLNVEGEDLIGVYPGIDFLKEVAFKNDIRFDGKKVLVVGGGNSAIDSARTAVRLGAQSVVIVYRRTMESMPADKAEIEAALSEGVQIITMVNPIKLTGQNGVLKEVVMTRMQQGEFDKSARRKTLPVKGSEFIMQADAVIVAVSQKLMTEFISKKVVSFAEWNGIGRYMEGYKSKKESGIFAGGDLYRGPSDVVTAISDGKTAACEIDKYLGGDGVLYKGPAVDIPDTHDEDEITSHPRFPKKTLAPEVAKTCFDECNLGLHKLDAHAEAMRCLRCDRR